MKRRIAILICTFFITLAGYSQAPVKPADKEDKDNVTQVDNAEEKGVRQILKEKFVEGGPVFMSLVLACLILGLAIALERIITLNLSTVNQKKLVVEVSNAIDRGDIEQAKLKCAETPGPVAALLQQGLQRANHGPEAVEKAIMSYGAVEMGKLEKGMSWISMFISLAPLLGFMGTVFGMIVAFDDIAANDDLTPATVATGIKQALLTTIAGLIVAVILQVFYNYCISKIDSLVSQMEEASTSFVNFLVSKSEIEKRA